MSNCCHCLFFQLDIHIFCIRLSFTLKYADSINITHHYLSHWSYAAYCNETYCWRCMQEFVDNQNLFKHINQMLEECEQKAVTCKKLSYKSRFRRLPHFMAKP